MSNSGQPEIGLSTSATAPAPAPTCAPSAVARPEQAPQRALVRAPVLRVFVAVLAVLAVALVGTAWHEIRFSGMDFQQDYIAAQRLLAGESLYTPFSSVEVAALGVREELGTGMRQNAHPPLAVLLIVPLTLLPFWAAALIWTVGCVALLLFTAWRLAAELALPLRGLVRALALLLLLSWYPVWLHLHLGQWTIPLMALTVEAWLCLRRGRNGWAGALLALAALIKIYPLLLFGYAVWRGRWRAVAAGVATMLLLVLVQTAIEPRHYVEYTAHTAGATDATWRVKPRNASLSTISARLFAGSDELAPLFELPAAELPTRAAIYALALAAFGAALWRARRHADLTGEYAAFVCAIALFSPISWEHAIIFMLLPLGYVWQRAREVGVRALRLPVVLAILALAISIYPAEPVLMHVKASAYPELMPLWVNVHAPGLAVLLLASAATLITLQTPRPFS